MNYNKIIEQARRSKKNPVLYLEKEGVSTKDARQMVEQYNKDKTVSLYSNWTGKPLTKGKIASQLGVSSKAIKKIVKVEGITHDSPPVSTDKVATTCPEELSSFILDERFTRLEDTFRAKKEQLVEEEAYNWRELLALNVTPLEKAIATFNAKPKLLEPSFDAKEASEETVIFCLSDLHLGLGAEAEELTQGETTNEEVQREQMANLTMQSREILKKYKPTKVVILLQGDILHGLNGSTCRGTKLECSTVRYKQFELALDTLSDFITTMSALTGEVTVRNVLGNHDGLSVYCLARALERGYTNTNVKFVLTHAVADMFVERGAMIVVEHGASDRFDRCRVPGHGAKREAYCLNRFAPIVRKHPHFHGEKLFLMGDLHHKEVQQYAQFTFMILPSMSAGDGYADAHGYTCKPEQLALVVNDEGIVATLSIKLDVK